MTTAARDIIPPALERVVLELVQGREGQASWHYVSTRVPLYDVPLDPNALTVLKALRDGGLLEQQLVGTSMDRWSLTARGLERLRELQGAAGAERDARATGPLDTDALASLVAALRGGIEGAIGALIPFGNDGPKMTAVLRQVLATDAALAQRVAFGAAMLPPGDRVAFARELLSDARASVRAALFSAWSAARMDVPGQAVRVLADDAWDALLERGLADADASVRTAAAALTFASDRAPRLRDALLANVDAPERELRYWSILALGADRDARSLARLLDIAENGEPLHAAAAVRALAARPDGHERWLEAFEDERDDVTNAAIFALADVAVQVSPARLAVLGADPRTSVQTALAAHRSRTSKN